MRASLAVLQQRQRYVELDVAEVGAGRGRSETKDYIKPPVQPVVSLDRREVAFTRQHICRCAPVWLALCAQTNLRPTVVAQTPTSFRPGITYRAEDPNRDYATLKDESHQRHGSGTDQNTLRAHDRIHTSDR